MYKPPEMDKKLYPAWANSLAWMIAMFPIVAIPGWALCKFCVNGGYEVRNITCSGRYRDLQGELRKKRGDSQPKIFLNFTCVYNTTLINKF